MYEAKGNDEVSDKYFLAEMRAKRQSRVEAARKEGTLEYLVARTVSGLEWFFVDLFSRYGTEWKQTFKMWGIILAVWAVFYGGLDAIGLLSINPTGGSVFDRVFNYSYISLSALVTSDPYVQFSSRVAIWVYAIEMGLGIYIWTQLLALFSRQFMRGA